MKHSILFLSLLSITSAAFSQVTLESQPVGTSRDGVLVMYGSSSMGNKRIPYDKISGSPFWKTEYINAMIIDRGNQILGKAPVKLNLYTNEVYFLTPRGEERVAAAGKVRKVIFYKDENYKEVLAIFENNVSTIIENNPQAENSSFVQVMNEGNFQLLKHIKMNFVTADSLFGTMKRYYFSDQSLYYFNVKGQIHRLKKLNKDNVYELIGNTTGYDAWIKQNNLNLKKEEDFLQFLQHVNETSK